MQSKKSYKKRNNKQKPSRNKLTSVLGKPLTKLVRNVETISSVSGSTALSFAGTGSSYWNLQSMSSNTDFTNVSDAYQLFRIRSFVVSINRIQSETVLSTIYVNGVPRLHIPYFPARTNYIAAAAQVVTNEASLYFSPMNVATSAKRFTVPDMVAIYSSGTADYALNPSKWMSTTLIGQISGCINIAGLFTSNATATLPLFTVEISCEIDFAAPY
jgi:hypothetical protein